MDGFYGEAPVNLGGVDLVDDTWHEFMHYLYLPVRIPWGDAGVDSTLALPKRLAFLSEAVRAAMLDAARTTLHLIDPYVYVTARRGFATPGNPLNRPGWHCDDFGGTDLNYIWADRWPTRFLTSAEPLDISPDDAASMIDMANYAALAESAADGGVPGAPWVEDGWPTNNLLRLTPYVIHDTPIIPEPGAMRSFFKISVSSHRYNLLGNSHNHLLDYDWPMYDRAEVRNRPQGGNSDYVEETTDAR